MRKKAMEAAKKTMGQMGRLGQIRKRHKSGAAPGTLSVEPNQPPTLMRVMAWDDAGLLEETITQVEALPALLERWRVVWLNVDGLGDEAILRGLGALFGAHRLALEDVVNVHQRPKAELYPDHYFIVMNMLSYEETISTEQVSFMVGKGWVVTFQEREGDCFDAVRERLRHGRGTIRQQGADYLAYALIDVLIDQYFPILERYGDRFEDMEERILETTSMDLLPEIRTIKRELNLLRRIVWPQRDALNALSREPTELISAETRVYLRDCIDHAAQLMDLVDTFRELAGGLLDMHMSMVSHRMNEVVQVLTIVTAIFVPLSFLTGLYGMNFNQELPGNMPELNTPYGYELLLGAMALLASGQLYFFWRRGWLAMGGEALRRRQAARARSLEEGRR